MLRYMRTHAASWGIKVILGLIIVVFVFWGVGRIESKKKTVVAKVGDRYITVGEFDRAYREALQFYRDFLGEALTRKRIKELRIPQEVLSRLIRSSLLLQEAEAWGLRASPEEIRQIIVQYPAFQRQGLFDRDLYFAFLRRRGLDPQDFEEGLRRQILTRRIEAALQGGVLVPEEESRRIFDGLYQEIELEFVLVPPEKVKGTVEGDEEALLRYFSEHQEAFRIPEKVEVLYLRCSPKDVIEEVEVKQQEVEDYYQDHTDAFRQPRRVRVRHIFLRFQQGKEEELRKRAEELLERLKKGEDFASLAKRYSEDPASAKRGGDLGYLTETELDPNFARVVFSLKKGEVGFARTAYGFHVVKVEDVQAERTKPLEEVKDEVLRRVRQQKAEDLCALRMADAAYGAKKRGDLRAFASEKGLQVYRTPPFCRAESIEGLGKRPKLKEVAFGLSEGEISSYVEDGGEFFVLQCLKRYPPRSPSFDEVKEEVRRRFLQEKAEEKARELAKEVLGRWREGKPLGEILRRYGLRLERTGFFPRLQAFIPKLGIGSPDLLTLTPSHPFPAEPVETPKGYAAVRLRAERPPSPEVRKAKAEEFQKVLGGLWQREVLTAWYNKRVEEVETELNKELLSRYGIGE